MPGLSTSAPAAEIYWTPTRDLILEEVRRHFGFGPRAVLGRWQDRDICQARFAAWWLARSLTAWSLPQIGRRLGGRDHTTVMSGIRRAGELHAADRDYARALDAARHRLKESFDAC
jgi:chromosomal replication initiator protein